MKICVSCGHENAEDARFCSQCATPLDAALEAREERKVVTCLFCDLVGFTARAERMDPEDVRRVLQPYHAQVRAELERHGGTVEKFIGDAVMAVFGAPATHEDDPERAVRAALAIREALAEGGDLEVRIGITTGEALIALGARPEAGEGMASGDVVNTAARLQGAAAPGSVLVDETTYRATERVIAYEPSPPIDAKGKSAPIDVWEAIRPTARVGVERQGGAPLMGRDRELTLLRETLAHLIREREPQLVTLVGVPGIGKSRLVYELFQAIETGEHGLVYWRHGRSLPYGDGVTFWALAEMVKAQAGVFETDDASRTEAKLRETLAALISDPADEEWLGTHLRPLVGLEVTSDTGTGRREEAFAAWRRFFEALAETRPLVLVFEDLHWADDALLDFVDYLVDWAGGVPILALGTARPELLSRRPGWGGGKPNALTLSLSPLSDDETAQVVHALLERPLLDADVHRALLERAGGNPLYAEEFVRMVSQGGDGDLVLPETVQGLIAARLDVLAPPEKELLQAASVLGKVFWLGGAAELAGIERWSAEEQLHALERKEFLRRERRTSVAGEVEYAFRHVLARDVAYGQVPRGVRAELHVHAARWIESLGRPDDHAEMVAYHYLQALELARAAGASIEGFADAAGDALREAGDRASSLNSFATSVRFYDDALALGSVSDTHRAETRFRRARALHMAGGNESEEALEEARVALLDTGETERAAEADALLAELWWQRGDRDRSSTHLTRAHVAVGDLPPSPAKAHVLSQVARYRTIAGDHDEGRRTGEDALAMAATLGLAELEANALDTIGLAKVYGGDLTGLDDLERSIEIAIAARAPEAARGYNNLGAMHFGLGDVRRARTLFGEAAAVADQLGGPTGSFSRSFETVLLFSGGEWEEGLSRADEFLAACDAGATHYNESGVRLRRARARLSRDDVAGALTDLAKTMAPARAAGDPQALVTALVLAARLYVEAGQPDKASALAREALAGDPVLWAISDLAWVAKALDCAAALGQWIRRTVIETKWHDAARALLEGNFRAAADLFEAIGALDDEALARLRGAEQLRAQGRRGEADEQLQRSLTFWRSVGATRYIREGEALLAKTA